AEGGGLPLYARGRGPGRRGAPRRDRGARRASPQAGRGERARTRSGAREAPLNRAALILLALAACKGAQTRDAPASAASGDPSIYYPLAVGNSWTYEYNPGGHRETIRIVSPDGPWFVDHHPGPIRVPPAALPAP